MARLTNFLEQYRNPGTRYSYTSGIVKFLQHTYGFERQKKHLSKEERERMEFLVDKYFIEDRDYEKDLISFANFLDKHHADTTGRLYISQIREFLAYNDVILSRRAEKNVKRKTPDGGPISDEDDLNPAIIRQLLNASGLPLKTLILVLVSSGMRISEALSLHKEDVKTADDGSYGIVTLRGKSLSRGTQLKNVHSRTTFVSKESVELLQQWYEVRKGYIETQCKRSRGRWTPKEIDDGRIFPFGDANAGQMLRTALRKAHLYHKDRDTKRASIHFHSFRKYFISRLTESGIPNKFVDHFAGHLGALDKAYQRQSKEKLIENYLKGEPLLRIYDEGVKVIAEQKEEIRETREKVRDMQIDSINLKQTLYDLERKHKAEIEERERKNEELRTELTALMERQKQAELNAEKIKIQSDAIEKQLKEDMELRKNQKGYASVRDRFAHTQFY